MQTGIMSSFLRQDCKKTDLLKYKWIHGLLVIAN